MIETDKDFVTLLLKQAIVPVSVDGTSYLLTLKTRTLKELYQACIWADEHGVTWTWDILETHAYVCYFEFKCRNEAFLFKLRFG
jgi:hypothetical protein